MQRDHRGPSPRSGAIGARPAAPAFTPQVAAALAVQRSAGNHALARAVAAGPRLARFPDGLRDIVLGPLAGAAFDQIEEAIDGRIDDLRENGFAQHRRDEDRTSSRETQVTRLEHQRYAHGGFMGAAGSMMKDQRWRAIFAELMPERHAQAAAIADTPVPGEPFGPGMVHSPELLMALLENNPVLAAYGSIRHQTEVAGNEEGAAPDAEHRALTLEWDVWLPPNAARVDGILDRSRIAHGDKTTTVMANQLPSDHHGLFPHLQRDLRAYARYRPDVLSEVTGGEWMQIFGRAIAKGRGESEDAVVEDEEAMVTRPKTPIEFALDYLGEHGGLLVDIKSTDSSAADVAAFVSELQGLGIRVMGVGSWTFSQLAEVGPGISRHKWAHGLVDLAEGLEQGRRPFGGDVGGLITSGIFGAAVPSYDADKAIGRGDTVMFNAGSLLVEDVPFHFVIDPAALAEVERLKTQYELDLGVYVQEDHISPQALELVIRLVNERADLFPAGFSWGNVNGRADTGSRGGSGLGMQFPMAEGGMHLEQRVRENL